MSTWTYEKGKRLHRIAGVWLDLAAVQAIEDTHDGVRLHLSSGARIDITASSSTGSPNYGVTADKVAKIIGDAK